VLPRLQQATTVGAVIVLGAAGVVFAFLPNRPAERPEPAQDRPEPTTERRTVPHPNVP
jgi:hypothetical protein